MHTAEQKIREQKLRRWHLKSSWWKRRSILFPASNSQQLKAAHPRPSCDVVEPRFTRTGHPCGFFVIIKSCNHNILILNWSYTIVCIKPHNRRQTSRKRADMMTLVGGTIPPNYQLNFTGNTNHGLHHRTHFRNWTSIQNQHLTNYAIHQATEIRSLLVSTTAFCFCSHGSKYPTAVRIWSSPIPLDLGWPPHPPQPWIIRRNCT